MVFSSVSENSVWSPSRVARSLSSSGTGDDVSDLGWLGSDWGELTRDEHSREFCRALSVALDWKVYRCWAIRRVSALRSSVVRFVASSM